MTPEMIFSVSNQAFDLFNSCLYCKRILKTLVLSQDMEIERRKSVNPDSAADDEVSEIKAAHFEESMEFARRSVGDADIRKYQAFSQTLQQSRGLGHAFRFSDYSSGATGSNHFAAPAGGADEEDDLYN